MTKLYIKYRTLSGTVSENINSAIRNLDNIVYNMGDLIIPMDFTYASYLKKLPNDISNLRSTLNSKKNLIKANADSYKSVESNNLNGFSSVKIFNLPIRKK